MIRKSSHSDSTQPFHRNERLEAFSDGVFAIVITLLVLELHIPQLVDVHSKKELFQSLFSIKNKLFDYILSFLFIGQLWVAHANFFRLIVKTDSPLFWINNMVLMCVSLIPFPTAMLGDYPGNGGAVISFGVLFTATGIFFGGMSWYCFAKKLYHPHADQKGFKIGSTIGTIATVISIIALFIANYYPGVALGIYFALILVYIFMQSLFKVQDMPVES